MTDVAHKISAFITASLLLDSGTDIAGTPSFLEAGIIDSTGVLELVHFLEETWNISVRDEEMVPANLDSLAKLEGYVKRKIGG
jgi:acyl carrier protein